VVQIPDGSERPQGAGYGSAGIAKATVAKAATMARTFILSEDRIAL
jgi:hypothetical protein